MKFQKRSLVAFALILAAGATVARSEAPATEDQVLQMLYQKLETVINGGATDGSTLLSLAKVGVQVTKSMRKDEHTLNTLFNKIPKATAVYQESDFTYAEVYDQILNNHVTRTTPLSDEQSKRLKAAMSQVSDENPDQQAYEKFRNQYYDALMERSNEQTNYKIAMQEYNKAKKEGTQGLALPKPVAPSIINAPENIMKKWMSQGRKSVIESANNTINELTNYDGGAWWDALSTRFGNAKKADPATGESTSTVKFFPPAKDWVKEIPGGTTDDGWVQFHFASTEQTTNDSFSHKDVNASASYHGSFTFGGNGGWAKTETMAKTGKKDVDITFKLKRVYIRRPWLEALVFQNTAWWFNPNAAGIPVSNGRKIGEAEGPAGRMPLMLNSIILCKDLKIKADWADTFVKEKQESLHVDANVSYGPLNLSGAYNQEDRSRDTKNTTADGSVIAPDVQIIGYVSNVVPKSPVGRP